MNKKTLGKSDTDTKKSEVQARTYPRPDWVPTSVSAEKELCPDCFKVVGERSRYNIVCMEGTPKMAHPF